MTMTHRPKITVFIPVFNRAAYVGEAIDSILAQSFNDFELLLVDDGSEDESLKVIKSRKDPRIRVVSATRAIASTMTPLNATSRGGSSPGPLCQARNKGPAVHPAPSTIMIATRAREPTVRSRPAPMAARLAWRFC